MSYILLNFENMCLIFPSAAVVFDRSWKNLFVKLFADVIWVTNDMAGFDFVANQNRVNFAMARKANKRFFWNDKLVDFFLVDAKKHN